MAYESFYEGKYKEADIQEKNLLKFLLDQIDGVSEILEVGYFEEPSYG